MEIKNEGSEGSCASDCSPPRHRDMDDAMKHLQAVIEYFAQQLKGKSGPVICWVPRGDCLSVFWEDVPYHAESASNVLTLCKAWEDNRIVGCKVHGLTKIMTQSVR